MLLFLSFIFMTFSSFALDPCANITDYTCKQPDQPMEDGTGKADMKAARRQLVEIYKTQYTDLLKGLKDIVAKNPALQERLGKADFMPGFSMDQKMENFAAYLLQSKIGELPDEAWPGGHIIQIPYTDFFQMAKNTDITNLVTEKVNTIQNQALAAGKVSRLESTYPKIIDSVKRLVGGLPDSPQKTAMLSHLDPKALPLKIEPCPLGLLIPEAGNQETSLQFCTSNLVTSDSLFHHIRTIAHELGHSLDPCHDGVTAADHSHPFRDVLQCLRGADSIHAGADPALGGSGDLPAFCLGSGDQLSESFSDWVGDEVLADLSVGTNALTDFKNLSPQQFSNGMANTFRALCDMAPGGKPKWVGPPIFPPGHTPPPSRPPPYDDHPTMSDRLNLLVSQPTLREHMGCSGSKAPQKYCPHTNSGAASSTSGKVEQ